MNTTTTATWQERATDAFLSDEGIGCDSCRSQGTRAILLRAINETGRTEADFLGLALDEKIAQAFRQQVIDMDRTAAATQHNSQAWLNGLRAAQAALREAPALTVEAKEEWFGIPFTFDGECLDVNNGLPQRPTLPEWLKRDAKVVRVSALPRFRSTTTSVIEPWSMTGAPVGVTYEVRELDLADNTASLRDPDGNYSGGWVPFVDLIPAPPIGDAPAEPVVETVVIDDPKDAEIARLRAELEQERLNALGARRAFQAWAIGVNGEANVVADEQNYCSEYEDINLRRIWPAGARAARTALERVGLPAGSIVMPEFEGRTKEFLVSGSMRITVDSFDIWVPVSTTVEAADEDEACENAEFETPDQSEIDDAIREHLRNNNVDYDGGEVDDLTAEVA